MYFRSWFIQLNRSFKYKIRSQKNFNFKRPYIWTGRSEKNTLYKRQQPTPEYNYDQPERPTVSPGFDHLCVVEDASHHSVTIPLQIWPPAWLFVSSGHFVSDRLVTKRLISSQIAVWITASETWYLSNISHKRMSDIHENYPQNAKITLLGPTKCRDLRAFLGVKSGLLILIRVKNLTFSIIFLTIQYIKPYLSNYLPA